MLLAEKTIAILIGGHLASAPRVQKEAAALARAGSRVFVRGTWSDQALAEEDCRLAKSLGIDFKPVVNLVDQSSRLVRAKQKLARILFLQFGIVTARAFGLSAPELLSEARKINADLTMLHSEAGLWVARQLLSDGHRVGVDFEDWFSQDLFESDRKTRPILQMQALERHLLSKADCCFTTSKAMAGAMAQDANVDRWPLVIPNCFPAAERQQVFNGTGDPRLDDAVSFYWFSQTIGPGRGLETLSEALPLLKGKWQLSIRGNLRGYREWFEQTFAGDTRAHVQVLDAVPNDELLERTISHDVGLALEIPYCANKELTASNKIFEYLRAGLAIIATNTLGQQEVMQACPQAGELVKPDDAASLANAMQKMIDDSVLLEKAKTASFEAGQQVWAWENFESVMIAAIQQTLEKKCS